MRRISLTLAASVLVATVLTAGPALASIEKKGGYSYVTSKKVSIKPGKVATVKATCPGKAHVLAGSSITDAPFNDVSTSVGIPFDGDDKDRAPDDGWIGQATSYAEQKIDLQAKAVCSSIKPKYVIDHSTAAPLAQTNTSVVCKHGDAIAGGMLGDVASNSGFPVGGTWSQFADNYRDKKQKVDVAAVCVGTDFDVTTSSSSVSSTTTTQGFNGCGGGTFAVNFGQSNNGGFFEFNTISINTFPNGASYALEHYTTSATTYTVYLICNEPLH